MSRCKWVGEPTPEELMLARQMVRAGKPLEEVRAALKWTYTLGATQNRLRKYGIPVRQGSKKRAHLGDETWVKKDEHNNKL